jgi:DNA polymerase-3 subunit epsilon
VSKVITFADTETTGLKPDKGDRIIEICLLGYDLDTRAKLFELTKRIHPGIKEIDPKASMIHGITNADLAGCPPFNHFIPVISKILTKTDLLVVHNLAFDLPFLLSEYQLYNQKLPGDCEGFCTMENGRWATWDGKLPNLSELCYALEVDYDPEAAHSAKYDTEVLAECFFKGYDQKAFKPNI